MKTIIVIPARNPELHLLKLVEQLNHLGQNRFPIVIVDDGSKEETQELFCRLEQEWDCIVLHHPENKGKGAALKTGFSYSKERWTDSCGCVTADADGQIGDLHYVVIVSDGRSEETEKAFINPLGVT